MPLALPDQPRRFYRANPLRLVVCQVRFPVIHRFDEPGALARFQDVLKDRYPRSAPEQQLAITVGPGGPVSGPAATSFWRFQGIDDRWMSLFHGTSSLLRPRRMSASSISRPA